MAWPFGYPDVARTQSVKSFSDRGNENRMSIDRSVWTKLDQIWFEEHSFPSYPDLVLDQDSANYVCQISRIGGNANH